MGRYKYIEVSALVTAAVYGARHGAYTKFMEYGQEQRWVFVPEIDIREVAITSSLLWLLSCLPPARPPIVETVSIFLKTYLSYWNPEFYATQRLDRSGVVC